MLEGVDEILGNIFNFEDWDASNWMAFLIIYGFILFLTWGIGKGASFSGIVPIPFYYKLIFTFICPVLIFFFINRGKQSG